MNKKFQVSFIVMAVMLFSMVLFYQNCSKNGGSLDLNGTTGCTVNCGTTGGTTPVSVVTSNASGNTSIFSYANDTLTFKVYNAGGVGIAYGCTAAHLNSASTPIASDLAACDVNPTQLPYRQMANDPSGVDWHIDASGIWNYSIHLNGSYFQRGTYKSCMYNASTTSLGCMTYTVN